jgi:hypothetical protein
MPLQNRVTPYGEIVAVEARGTLMGNRGCLHDENRRIRRPFATRRWIACVLEFRGRHRQVMSPGRYTELFFLDEATALAAGHRPCAECRREDYCRFREAWAAANGGRDGAALPSADEMDAVLHAERLDDLRGKRTYTAPAAGLPPGVMVAGEDGRPYLVGVDWLAPWRPEGYGPRVARPRDAVLRVLTPPSIVRAIAAGYIVKTHPESAVKR